MQILIRGRGRGQSEGVAIFVHRVNMAHAPY